MKFGSKILASVHDVGEVLQAIPKDPRGWGPLVQDKVIRAAARKIWNHPRLQPVRRRVSVVLVSAAIGTGCGTGDVSDGYSIGDMSKFEREPGDKDSSPNVGEEKHDPDQILRGEILNELPPKVRGVYIKLEGRILGETGYLMTLPEMIIIMNDYPRICELLLIHLKTIEGLPRLRVVEVLGYAQFHEQALMNLIVRRLRVLRDKAQLQTDANLLTTLQIALRQLTGREA